MNRLHSYPKVFALGHPAIKSLFAGPVLVQEKIDGSQFSFGVPDEGERAGDLLCRSKGADIHLETTDKLFRPAVNTAMALWRSGSLLPGVTYRAEALSKPKHNTVSYSRAPGSGMILFDVDVGLENRISDSAALAAVAEELGLEHVPTFFSGEITDIGGLRALLETESMLGGSKVEGVVVKNYGRWGDYGKMLMGKLVREDFVEQNKIDWRRRNPTRSDVVASLIEQYHSERRWQKAVQALRDDGQLELSPRDIGKLIKAVPADVREECEVEISSILFRHFWPEIQRGITKGLPQWYKQWLVEQQFGA